MRHREDALELAAHGFPVFPVWVYCEDDHWRKQPLVKEWHIVATTAHGVIEAWWDRWPNAQVAIPLGRCNRVILDADRHPGGPDGVAMLAEMDLPPCPIDLTISGGEHRIFRQPDPPIQSTKWAGGEILGPKRLTVVYSIEPFITPAPVWPRDLLERLPKVQVNHAPGPRLETPIVCVVNTGLVSRNSREGRYARAALENAFQKFVNWPREERGRNDMLNKQAFKMGGLVANGWIDAAVVVRVLMLGADDCGLLREDGAEQCLATIRSGLSAGMKFPYPQLGPL